MRTIQVKIKLTPRQYDLLFCDSGADNCAADYYGKKIGDELRGGKVLTVTPAVTEMIKDLADHDADTNEQRVYRNLLKKIQKMQIP